VIFLSRLASGSLSLAAQGFDVTTRRPAWCSSLASAPASGDDPEQGGAQHHL